MFSKQIVALAALACAATSAAAFDEIGRTHTPGVTFFYSIPLDAANARDKAANFGMQIQGQRGYQAATIDYRTLSFLPMGGLEVKLVVAGVVAAGAAVAVSQKDKKAEEGYQQQQQAQAEACAQNPSCPK